MSDTEDEAFFMIRSDLEQSDQERLDDPGEEMLLQFQLRFKGFERITHSLRIIMALSWPCDMQTMQDIKLALRKFREARRQYREWMPELCPRSQKLLKELIMEADSFIATVEGYAAKWNHLKDYRKFK